MEDRGCKLKLRTYKLSIILLVVESLKRNNLQVNLSELPEMPSLFDLSKMVCQEQYFCCEVTLIKM